MAKVDPVVTQSMLKEAVEDITSVIGAFAARVDERFNAVDERFEQVDARFKQIDARFDTLEARMDERFNVIEQQIRELNEKYDHLVSTLDTFLKRLDDMEIQNVARDAHLARLDRWLHQLADHAGVKLK